jgi:hypothetical protein
MWNSSDSNGNNYNNIFLSHTYKQLTMDIFGGSIRDASHVDYDGTTSGLTGENVQDAIDELDTAVDAVGAGVTSNDTSTGLLTGGLLSIGTPTSTFSITDGTGQIVDRVGDTITDITWSGLTNITATYLTVDVVSYVGIQAGPTVIQQLTPFNSFQKLSTICLGVLVHSSLALSVVQAVNNLPSTKYQPRHALGDFMEAIGYINVSGNIISNNVGAKTINKSAGSLFKQGANYENLSDPTLKLTGEHVLATPIIAPTSFRYRMADGTESGLDLTFINNTIWDDGDTYATASAVTNNYYTIQRVYLFPSNLIRIQLGQAEYQTESDARAGLFSESFDTETNIADNAILRCLIIVKQGDANNDTASFIAAGKFGQVLNGGSLGASGPILATEVTMLNTTGATYTTLEDLDTIANSSGWVSGGAITDATGGAVDVALGSGFLRSGATSTSPLYSIDWAQSLALALTDANLNYIYVDYNSGTPIVGASTTKPNGFDRVVIGTAFRDGTTLYIVEAARETVNDSTGINIHRNEELGYIQLIENGGALVSHVGTNNIAITSATWWLAQTRYTTAAVDTSSGDTFTYYYNITSPSSYTEVLTQTAINNTQYDNAGTLTALSNNQYGTHYIYKGASGDSYVIYGTGNFNLTQAEQDTAPSITPQHFSKYAVLIAKVIIKKSATGFTDVLSAFADGISYGTVTANVVNGTPADNEIARFDTNNNTIQGTGITINDTTTSIVPITTNISDLGTASLTFKDSYLSGESTQNTLAVYSSGYAEMYSTAALITSTLTTGVWYKSTFTTTAGNSLIQGFTHTTPNKLSRVGNDRVFKVSCSFSFTVNAAGANTWNFGISKNGADPVADSENQISINAANFAFNMTLNKIVLLKDTDYIELWNQRSFGTVDLTISKFVMDVVELTHLATPLTATPQDLTGFSSDAEFLVTDGSPVTGGPSWYNYDGSNNPWNGVNNNYAVTTGLAPGTVPTGFNPVTGGLGTAIYGCWHRVELQNPTLITGVQLMRANGDVLYTPEKFRIYRSTTTTNYDLVYEYTAGGITWGGDGVYATDTFEWDPVYAKYIVIVITAKLGNAQTNMQMRAINYY